MIRVCHLSSVHRGLDVRIFHKECASLAVAGYDTHLVIVANEKEVFTARKKGVTVHALELPIGRFTRMVKQAWCCYKIGKKIDANIYHFHDAELIPYGIILSLLGKKVIYDVHEDLPKDILTKDWIPHWGRRVMARFAHIVEYIGARYFFSISAATPSIRDRFSSLGAHCIDINNFPLVSELPDFLSWQNKKNEICYVGGIGKTRGIVEICDAMGIVENEVRLNLCGRFSEPVVEQKVKLSHGWRYINECGFLDRAGVQDTYSRSVAGLVTLHPISNYLDSLPVKMFEYMGAGIPVIASDFPLWREIIGGNQCGLLVDPLNPKEIAVAIDYLIDNPEGARRMGENGRKVVFKKYNWVVEEKKMLQFYEEVLSK